MKKKVYPVKASWASGDKDVPLKSAQFTFVIGYRSDWDEDEDIGREIAHMIDSIPHLKCIDGWVDEKSIADWKYEWK